MILSLIQNPNEFRLLGQGYTLIHSTIEETLRYRSPVQAVSRIVTKDIKLREQKIQAGDRIIVWIGSANHDEFVFTDPEQFNIKRSNSISHVGFGYGIHFCLGAPLARLEGLVVLRVILQRLQDLMLDPEYSKNDVQGLSPIQSVFFHGVAQLPLHFRARCELNQN